MLSLFKKDPSAKLKKQHAALLAKALEAQRRGDIRSYSQLITDAETVADKIDALNSIAD